jgi:D-alanine-D-alanine ligase
MMKICVLQADYGGSKVDYQYFDPKRDLSGLIPDAHFDHVFLNKLTCYRQLKELSYQQYDIFVNLCEGYLEWDIPSIDVIYSLELLDLPFTGPTTKLYDPPKDLMKYVAYCEGIKTPAYLKIMGFLTTFKKFPPRQRPGSFTIDDKMVEKFMTP